jgi:hypothetical protein
MKKFSEIYESFDKPVKWKVITDIPKLKVYKWRIGDFEYELIAEKVDEKKDIWEVSFTSGPLMGLQTNKVTGTGNELQVFATVLDIISQDLVPSIDMKQIVFSASKSEHGMKTGRAKLYKRLVKRYLPKGWNSKTIDEKVGREEHLVFLLTKER